MAEYTKCAEFNYFNGGNEDDDFEDFPEERNLIWEVFAESYISDASDCLEEEDFERENYLYYYFKYYFFKDDLDSLNFNTYVHVFDDKRISDENSKYWGGTNWENIHDDLYYWEEADKTLLALFLYSLFTITLIDLNMHFNYSDKYLEFRKKTYWPDFGNWGFGSNHGKVWKILLEPVREGFISLDCLKTELDEFFEFFEYFAGDFLNKRCHLDIDMNEFFSKIAEDKTMNNLERKKDAVEGRYTPEMIDFMNGVTAMFRKMGEEVKLWQK